MQAMELRRPGESLVMVTRSDPVPAEHQVRLRIAACAVCRTDLHVVDGELPVRTSPIIPGHEIVGYVDAVGAGVSLRLGQRVGVPWLGQTCGWCSYCLSGRENLCDDPTFTGYTRDGGYATHVIADARYVIHLPDAGDDVATAPLMCAGLIGWRSLRMAGPGKRIGLYGFGAAAHIIAQVARWQGREVYAFTRSGDEKAQALALKLGAHWAGSSDDRPDQPLDCAIIYAPVGALVPAALQSVRKGGRVVCAGIHMSDIPSFPYSLLWQERELVSVANLTRQDAIDFLDVVAKVPITMETTIYPLNAANQALSDLRSGALQGAAVLVP
jgi:propanol-preferring alcohol dehydrogenase